MLHYVRTIMKNRHFKIHDYFLIFIALFGFVFFTVERLPEIKGIVMGPFIKYKKTDGEVIISQQSTIGGYGVNIRSYMISYVYFVDNVLLESKQITFSYNYSDWKPYLLKYPKGKKVTVYYDEDNPSFAVLEPENRSYFVFVMPLLFLSLFTYEILRIIVTRRLK